jgi:C4-dicarboxylate transporter DctQ subunit
MSRISHYLDIFEDNIIAICLLLATGMVTLNVILRFFFGAGISWSDELVRYSMILITFVGASVCVRKGSHIAVDFIQIYMNKKQIRILEIFINTVGVIFSVMLTVFSIAIIKRNIEFPQLSPALQIPMYIPYLTIPLGFGLCAIRYTQRIISDISRKEAKQS